MARTLAALALLALLGGSGNEHSERRGQSHTLSPADVVPVASQPHVRATEVAAAALRRVGTRELTPRGVVEITARYATRAAGTARSKWRRLARMDLDGDH